MKEFQLDDNGKSFIIIDETMRLCITPRNWQLQKKKVAGKDSKKAGEISWEGFRYYVSLQNALNDIVHIMTSAEDFNSVQGLLDANQRVITELSRTLSPKYTINEVK
jgi:hypothetical protein